MHSTRCRSGIETSSSNEKAKLVFESPLGEFKTTLSKLNHCKHANKKNVICPCLTQFLNQYQKLVAYADIHYDNNAKHHLEQAHLAIRKIFPLGHAKQKFICSHLQTIIKNPKSIKLSDPTRYQKVCIRLWPLFSREKAPLSESSSSASLSTDTTSDLSDDSHSDEEIPSHASPQTTPTHRQTIAGIAQLSSAPQPDADAQDKQDKTGQSKTRFQRLKAWLKEEPKNLSKDFKNDAKDVRDKNSLFKSVKDWFGVEANSEKLFLNQVNQHHHASAGILNFLSPNAIATLTAIANSLTFFKLGIAVIADLITFASATMLGTRARWIRIIEGGAKIIGLVLRITSFVFGLIPGLKPLSYVIDLARSALGNTNDARRTFSCFSEWFDVHTALSLLKSSSTLSKKAEKALSDLKIKYDANHPDISTIKVELEKKRKEAKSSCINSLHDNFVNVLYLVSAILCVIPGLLPAGLLMGSIVGYYDTADKGGFNPFKQIGKLLFGNVLSSKEKNHSNLSPEEKIKREQKELQKKDKYWNRIIIGALFITAVTLLSLISVATAGYFLIIPFTLFIIPAIVLWGFDRFSNRYISTAIRETAQKFKNYCMKKIPSVINKCLNHLQTKLTIAINKNLKIIKTLHRAMGAPFSKLANLFSRKEKLRITSALETTAEMRRPFHSPASPPPAQNALPIPKRNPNILSQTSSSTTQQNTPSITLSSPASSTFKKNPAAAENVEIHLGTDLSSKKAGILFGNQETKTSLKPRSSIHKSSPVILKNLQTNASNSNSHTPKNTTAQTPLSRTKPININSIQTTQLTRSPNHSHQTFFSSQKSQSHSLPHKKKFLLFDDSSHLTFSNSPSMS